MQQFEPAELPVLTVEGLMAKFSITREEAVNYTVEQVNARVVMNDKFQVNVSKIRAPFGDKLGDMVWLSIKHRDKTPIHDWRELQTIKNMLVGAECEGFEIYPAESRMVDTSNQYHLWVFVSPKVRLPVGYQQREVRTPEQVAATGAVQRPFT